MHLILGFLVFKVVLSVFEVTETKYIFSIFKENLHHIVYESIIPGLSN